MINEFESEEGSTVGTMSTMVGDGAAGRKATKKKPRSAQIVVYHIRSSESDFKL